MTTLHSHRKAPGFSSFVALVLALFATEACLRMEAPSVRSEQKKSAVFIHSGSESNCSQCHESRRPTMAGGLMHGDGRECSGCHQTNPTEPAWTKDLLAFDHGYGPTSCIACHEASRPAESHYPAPGPSPLAGHFGSKDCSECHIAREAAYPNFVFKHKDAKQQVVSSCLPCHEAKRPVDLVKRFSHPISGMGDCVDCHFLPGSIWSSGIYRHNPPPAACGTCHAGDRPSIPVNRFLHAAVDTDECLSCHVNASSGNSWTGGSAYTHLPVPGACAGCHETNRPKTTLHLFSHLSGSGAGDCKTCHTRVGIGWSNALGYSTHHGSWRYCASCH